MGPKESPETGGEAGPLKWVTFHQRCTLRQDSRSHTGSTAGMWTRAPRQLQSHGRLQEKPRRQGENPFSQQRMSADGVCLTAV
ncbi:hypothetical protein AAFF_G00333250 [Aldrovandia affinis]|uniref:Uncharacterized protein n=1 Tax=Aldrovandia affinis TaxID=143900 RepID=A0AAD7WQ64_9TELE|nr:hypothetical protein AAFF_G00333250 [Aldrovandia affinis]